MESHSVTSEGLQLDMKPDISESPCDRTCELVLPENITQNEASDGILKAISYLHNLSIDVHHHLQSLLSIWQLITEHNSETKTAAHCHDSVPSPSGETSPTGSSADFRKSDITKFSVTQDSQELELKNEALPCDDNDQNQEESVNLIEVNEHDEERKISDHGYHKDSKDDSNFTILDNIRQLCENSNEIDGNNLEIDEHDNDNDGECAPGESDNVEDEEFTEAKTDYDNIMATSETFDRQHTGGVQNNEVTTPGSTLVLRPKRRVTKPAKLINNDTIPDCLVLLKAKGLGIGVYTKSHVSKGTLFGPCPSKTAARCGDEDIITISAVESPDVHMDHVADCYQEWFKHVESASDLKTPTVTLIRYKEQLFLQTNGDLPPDTQLLLCREIPGNAKTQKLYGCEKCSRCYQQKAALARHAKTCMGNEDKKHKEYDCHQCDRTFKSPSALLYHKKVHSGTKAYCCKVCDKKFTARCALENHMYTHSDKRPFMCNECGRTFTQLGNLQTHERVHSGERPYSCSVCGERFSHSSTLNAHQLRHTGERNYQCPVCGKRYYRSDVLKLHMNLHTDTSYRCEVCGKSFQQQGYLTTHMTTHTNKRHMCTTCGQQFTRSQTLKRHILVVHQHKGKRYPCDQCNKTFSRTSHLNRHVKLTHASPSQTDTVHTQGNFVQQIDQSQGNIVQQIDQSQGNIVQQIDQSQTNIVQQIDQSEGNIVQATPHFVVQKTVCPQGDIVQQNVQSVGNIVQTHIKPKANIVQKSVVQPSDQPQRNIVQPGQSNVQLRHNLTQISDQPISNISQINVQPQGNIVSTIAGTQGSIILSSDKSLNSMGQASDQSLQNIVQTNVQTQGNILHASNLSQHVQSNIMQLSTPTLCSSLPQNSIQTSTQFHGNHVPISREEQSGQPQTYNTYTVAHPVSVQPHPDVQNQDLGNNSIGQPSVSCIFTDNSVIEIATDPQIPRQLILSRNTLL